MSLPLLQTKLYIPPVRRRLVIRPRLNEKLNQGLDDKLILVSAPAGYGKTTVLSIWLSQCAYTATWLSLDEGDNDPTRFLTYLVAALQKIHAEIGQTVISMLQSPQVVSSNVILSHLINDVTQLHDHFVLVLDDYHVIQETRVHQAVNYLLEQLPWQMHLVISTRADPPLPLARLRSQSQMLELRATDLCFSAEETEEYLNQAMGLALSNGDIGTINARTEGWIAGLQMAAVSLEGRQDASQFIRDFAGSNRHVLDYLMEEVLERQSEAIQDFLLKTSVLDDLNGSLCDAVTNQRDSQSMLEWLDRANLFIVSLDDQRFRYRYHHLFSDLLRQRLQRNDPEQVPALHLRASEWYEGKGLAADAIRHAFAAGEYQRAARLIEETADKSLMHGEVKTFLDWVERVPEAVACRRPLLCVYHAEALLLSGRPIDQVAARLEGAPEYDAIQVLMAVNQGNVELSKRLSTQVLDHLPEQSTFLRGAITSSLGVVFLLSGDVEPTIRTFQASAEIAGRNGYLFLEVIAQVRLGQMYQVKGELRKAESYFQKALELASHPQGGYLPIASMALANLGFLAREWNDLQAALKFSLKALELAQESGGFWSVDCFVIHALVLQSLGELEKAGDAMRNARSLAGITIANRFDDLYTAAYEADLNLAQGNLEAAVRWVRENDLDRKGVPGQPAAESRYNPALFHFVELEQIVLARILVAQGNYDKALATLEPLLIETDRLKRRARVAENLAIQALAYQGMGNLDRALKKLEEALSIAGPEGIACIFIEEGRPMERLLRVAEVRGIGREYVPRLLQGFGKGKSVNVSTTPKDELIDELSKRELEVLGLIAQGLTNDEIAGRLYISLSTVKGHTANIYSKLDVRSRTQAVARGRSLGLLPSEDPHGSTYP